MALRACALASRVLAAAVAPAIVLGAPAIARAEEPAAGVDLVVESAPWALDVEAVREAISREISGSVTFAGEASAGRAALFVRSEPDGRITLTHRSEDGRRIERTIDVPGDPGRAAETIALLAGNLVRDESAELTALLAERPSGAPGGAPPGGATAVENPGHAQPASKGSTPHAQPSSKGPAPHAAPKAPVRSDRAPRLPCSRPGLDTVVGGADFLPHVGTSTATGTGVVRRFSVNFLAGYTAGLAGLELGIGVHIERTFMCGAQLSAAGNVVTGPVLGVQMAAAFNAGTSLHGAQLGTINVVAGPARGAQLGVVNVSGRMHGAQLGVIDIAAGETIGAQLGVINVAAGETTGAQLGVVNVAAGGTTGAQLGVVNVSTGRVGGTQIGVINYADRSSLSIGLVNIVRRGRLHLDAWGQESGIVMVGLKHGSDHFHNIYAAGARAAGDGVRLAATLGMGAHFPIGQRVYVDLDVLGSSLHDPSSLATPTILGQIRALAGLHLDRRFAIYGGPSYNIAYSFDPERAELSPYGSLLLHGDAAGALRGWPGVVLGVQAF